MSTYNHRRATNIIEEKIIIRRIIKKSRRNQPHPLVVVCIEILLLKNVEFLDQRLHKTGKFFTCALFGLKKMIFFWLESVKIILIVTYDMKIVKNAGKKYGKHVTDILIIMFHFE